MVAAAAQPAPTAPDASPIKLGRCLGVEVFASGQYRGSSWTNDELDEMVRNFWKLGPLGLKLLEPPLVVGHEESQDFLDRTDLPSAGWLTTLRRVGDVLVGDVTGVPLAIANLINARLYKKVSAEIYDDFVDDHGTSYGLAIRRLALLGGEIPQVKRLADLPMVTFSEAKPRRYAFRRASATFTPSRGTWISFSEVSPMNRDQAVAALKALMPTLDQAVIDTMTDDQVIALANCQPAPVAPAPAPVAPMSDMSRDQMVTELVALGQDPLVLGPMSDEQINELYESLLGVPVTTPPVVPMADEVPLSRDAMIASLVDAGKVEADLQSKTDQELTDMLKAIVPPAPAPAVAAMGDAMKKVTKYSEQAINAIKAANRRLVEAQKAHDRQAAAQKKVLCEMFAEKLVGEGKLTPAFKPAVVADLMSADDVKLHRFSDKGATVEGTVFAEKKAIYEAAPVIIKFGEKLKGSAAGANDDEARVKRFAAERLPGKTGESFVHNFTEAKKKKPTLTAAEAGVPADFV
jgi:hypothetical protein